MIYVLWSVFGQSHPQSRATPVFPMASWVSTPVAIRLGYDLERHVAGERAAGRGDGDVTCGCASGNGGFQECVGNHCEAGGDSIKQDGTRSGKALPQNAVGLLNSPSRKYKAHKGSKPRVQSVHSPASNRVATADVSSRRRCSIKHPVSGLEQSTHRGVAITAESVKQRERTVGINVEQCATTLVAMAVAG